jgi:hypothetical protein
MRNSESALSGSRRRFETPPNRKSVIECTGSLKRRATIECESSWRSTLPKKSRVVTAASSIRSPGSSGRSSENVS